jgi:hypothetical protein
LTTTAIGPGIGPSGIPRTTAPHHAACQFPSGKPPKSRSVRPARRPHVVRSRVAAGPASARLNAESRIDEVLPGHTDRVSRWTKANARRFVRAGRRR